MASVRIALANLPYPRNPEESVTRATAAIRDAAAAGAEIVCFPECYVPGYRHADWPVPPPDAAFLERAWADIGRQAAASNIAVILGTERIVDGKPMITALVFNPDGSMAGRQDKGQIDPSEDDLYLAGDNQRHVFRSGPLTFGVAICHEGWRYPESVRWPAKHGAQVVFHPHFHWADATSYRPTTFADPKNTFHEKAALCRAAENTIFFAMVNYATDGSGTTSAVARPDGSLLAYQPYGQAGLLIADLDITEATRLLATRCKDY
jgi:predicted amidohydrolase